MGAWQCTRARGQAMRACSWTLRMFEDPATSSPLSPGSQVSLMAASSCCRTRRQQVRVLKSQSSRRSIVSRRCKHLATLRSKGGLLSYGADNIDIHRQAGNYVARIPRGASPRDLPVQNSIKYQLVVNLRAAKATGLAISETFPLRANEVIRGREWRRRPGFPHRGVRLSIAVANDPAVLA